MKAKQLMIGDLIYTRDITAKNYIRITAIDGTANFIRGIYLNNNEDTGWFCCDLAYEIKLTAEILKANGFEIDTPCIMLYRPNEIDGHYNYNGIYQYIEVSFRRDEIYKIEIYNRVGEKQYGITIISSDISVHQLQQALRLCKLNNLADNFKLA